MCSLHYLYLKCSSIFNTKRNSSNNTITLPFSDRPLPIIRRDIVLKIFTMFCRNIFYWLLKPHRKSLGFNGRSSVCYGFQQKTTFGFSMGFNCWDVFTNFMINSCPDYPHQNYPLPEIRALINGVIRHLLVPSKGRHSNPCFCWGWFWWG